jgi:hypothetical protein
VVCASAAANGGKRPPVNWAATQQGQETIVNPAHANHRGQAGEYPPLRSSPDPRSPADGTPAWQISLIAASAALFAAPLAVTA